VTEGAYVEKWHLRYKTSDISETKQSIAKVTSLRNVYRNVCTAYRLVIYMYLVT